MFNATQVLPFADLVALLQCSEPVDPNLDHCLLKMGSRVLVDVEIKLPHNQLRTLSVTEDVHSPQLINFYDIHFQVTS